MRKPGALERLFNTQTFGSHPEQSLRPVSAQMSDKNRGVPGVTTIDFSDKGKIARQPGSRGSPKKKDRATVRLVLEKSKTVHR